MEKKRSHRCFVAIEFPNDIVKEIVRVQDNLGSVNFVGKLTELGNLHLTLKFLGEINDEKLKKVEEALENIEIDKFSASLGEVGLFKYKNTPRIVWVKINGRGMFELQKEIDEALERLGWKVENRFMSHLTIARIKYVKDKKGFEKHIKSVKAKNLKFEVKDFKLKESELQSRGPVYSDLKGYELEN